MDDPDHTNADRFVHRVDGDVVREAYEAATNHGRYVEPETSHPTPAPANRHQRRRYAALSRRSQTR